MNKAWGSLSRSFHSSRLVADKLGGASVKGSSQLCAGKSSLPAHSVQNEWSVKPGARHWTCVIFLVPSFCSHYFLCSLLLLYLLDFVLSRPWTCPVLHSRIWCHWSVKSLKSVGVQSKKFDFPNILRRFHSPLVTFVYKKYSLVWDFNLI